MLPRSRVLVAGALVTVAAVSGCGETGGDPDPGSAPTDLTISVAPEAGALPRIWELRCDPATGTHPDPRAACAFLDQQADARRDPFAPVPGDVACTEIYGGPGVAAVEGRWRGRPVAATFTLTDGCQIARWQTAAALLGDPPPFD